MNLKKIERIFDMANLPPRRTGLKYQIWYGSKVSKHLPRIKVSLKDSELSIEILSHKVRGDESKIDSSDLKLILEWIDLNKEVLLDYWENADSGSIDPVEVAQRITKVADSATQIKDSTEVWESG